MIARTCAAMAIVSLATIVPVADSGEIRFSVRGASDDAAVPHVDAAVYLGSHQLADGVTDDHGDVAFSIPEPGDYRIVFRRDDCLPVTRELSVPASDDTPIEVQLPATGTIETIVRRTGESWESSKQAATVTVGRARDLRRSPDNWYRGAIAKRTDKNGRALFCVNSGKPYDVIVKHPGYAHAARYGIVAAVDGTERVEIAIKPRVFSCPRIKGR